MKYKQIRPKTKYKVGDKLALTGDRPNTYGYIVEEVHKFIKGEDQHYRIKQILDSYGNHVSVYDSDIIRGSWREQSLLPYGTLRKKK